MIDINQFPQVACLVLDNGWEYHENMWIPNEPHEKTWKHVFTDKINFVYSNGGLLDKWYFMDKNKKLWADPLLGKVVDFLIANEIIKTTADIRCNYFYQLLNNPKIKQVSSIEEYKQEMKLRTK